MNRSLMKSILRGDRGENSIMQTVSIAVSAILIAGGTMGAPGMIMKARETAARTTIATIATAQASYIAKKGGYTNRLSQLNSSFMGNALDLSLCGAAATNTATDNCASINVITGVNLAEGSSCYLTFEKTAAGKVYFIQSKGMSGASSAVEIPQPWPSTAKAFKIGGSASVPSDTIVGFADPLTGFDTSCATGGVWPSSLAAAMTKQAMASDVAGAAGDVVPVAPASFIVTSKSGNVFNLGWTKSPTATSYTLSYAGTIYNTFPDGNTVSGSVTLPWSTSGNLSLVASLNTTDSAPSNIAVTTTAESLAVSTPTNFAIVAQSGNQLNLSWSQATNATGYTVSYGGSVVATISSGTTTTAAVTLPWSTSGNISLVASSASNVSGTVTVPATIPAYMAAVGSVSLASEIGNDGTVSWSTISGATGYERSVNGIITAGSVTNNAPFSGSNGATYNVQVRATNGTYKAAWSPMLTFAMPGDRTTSQTFSSSGSTGFSGSVTRFNSGLTSINGFYSVTMQADGNFVMYDNRNGTSHGATATYASGAGVYARMQTDGNLVIYTSANVAVKSTGTSGNPGARVVMQDDGNLVIYNTSNVAIWALSTNSGTSFMQKIGW